MMDLDESRGLDRICPCGARLTVADMGFGESATRHCSELCYEREARATWLSAPVFVAPRPLNLRDHLLSELALSVQPARR
jgi:hypothetical protein